MVNQPSVTKLLRVLASPPLAKHVTTCRLFSSAPWSSPRSAGSQIKKSTSEKIVPLLQDAFRSMCNLTALFVTHSAGTRMFDLHHVIPVPTFALKSLQFHYQEDPDQSIWALVALQEHVTYFSYISIKQQLLILPPTVQPILPSVQTLRCSLASAAMLLHPPRASLKRLILDTWDGGQPLAEQSPSITSLVLEAHSLAAALGSLYLPYFPHLMFLQLQFLDDLVSQLLNNSYEHLCFLVGEKRREYWPPRDSEACTSSACCTENDSPKYRYSNIRPPVNGAGLTAR